VIACRPSDRRPRARWGTPEKREYHAAARTRHLEARLNEHSKTSLARRSSSTRVRWPTDVVVFGAQVKVKDLDGDEENYFISSARGRGLHGQKILTKEPVGQAVGKYDR